MNLLVVDNRDSFTFNLVDAFALAGADVTVVRNHIAADAAIERANGGAILLSPGPGTPQEAGNCLAICDAARGRVPLIGICLGHQAIVAAAGGKVVRAERPAHARVTRLAHDATGLTRGLPNPLAIGRYHSLCTPTADLPASLAAEATHGAMAMIVRDRPGLQVGLQFHPESILTPRGDMLVANLLDWARDAVSIARAA